MKDAPDAVLDRGHDDVVPGEVCGTSQIIISLGDQGLGPRKSQGLRSYNRQPTSATEKSQINIQEESERVAKPAVDLFCLDFCSCGLAVYLVLKVRMHLRNRANVHNYRQWRGMCQQIAFIINSMLRHATEKSLHSHHHHHYASLNVPRGSLGHQR